MGIDRLYANVKGGLTYSDLELVVFKFIKTNLVSILLLMQKEQLFSLSIGADGVALGRYSFEKKEQVFRAVGEPYDMVFSGKLQNTVNVRVDKRSIKFYASSEYMTSIRFDTKVFGTSDWFGLSHDNMQKLIDDWLLSVTIGNVKHKILKGSWLN